MSIPWPTARLTPIARARAMAAGLPGSGYAEITIDRPYAEAWAALMDLEHSGPSADYLVRSIRVHARTIEDDGVEHLEMISRSPAGLGQRFDVRVEDGYCLMRARHRLFVVVMAAEPDPDDPTKTRYAHVEAIPRRGTRVLRRVMRRLVADDVQGFRRHLEG